MCLHCIGRLVLTTTEQRPQLDTAITAPAAMAFAAASFHRALKSMSGHAWDAALALTPDRYEVRRVHRSEGDGKVLSHVLVVANPDFAAQLNGRRGDLELLKRPAEGSHCCPHRRNCPRIGLEIERISRHDVAADPGLFIKLKAHDACPVDWAARSWR